MSTKTITKIVVALAIIATVLLAATMVFGAGVTIPETSNPSTDGGLASSTSNILGLVSYICYAAAIIMLVVLGVKYVSAAPEGKAEIKKTAVQYVIGAILVFAAGTVVRIIKSVSDNNITT